MMQVDNKPSYETEAELTLLHEGAADYWSQKLISYLILAEITGMITLIIYVMITEHPVIAIYFVVVSAIAFIFGAFQLAIAMHALQMQHLARARGFHVMLSGRLFVLDSPMEAESRHDLLDFGDIIKNTRADYFSFAFQRGLQIEGAILKSCRFTAFGWILSITTYAFFI